MRVINQPFDEQLGNVLINLLHGSEYRKLTCFVAFAKNSGVLRLKEAFDTFRSNGGEITVFIGIDLNGTSYEALTNLRSCIDSLYVVHFEGGQTFHPKFYFFEGKTRDTLIVGSNNLTGGGLWTNCESSILVDSEKSGNDPSIVQLEFERCLRDVTGVGRSCMFIESQNQLEKLLQNGYLTKEIVESIRRIKEKKKANNDYPSLEKCFSNGVSARIPTLRRSPETSQDEEQQLELKSDNFDAQNNQSTSSNESFQSIWIYSGAMTGGSRNILDLSKKSRLISGNPSGTVFSIGEQGFIIGSVAFFGVDPYDEAKTKDIVINYDGKDYFGNTILFANDNGTWRMQIKGTDSTGKKITDSFREKGNDFLVKKVLSFTRINEDYFVLSVSPVDMINEFIDASFVVARNGVSPNSKQYGIIKTN